MNFSYSSRTLFPLFVLFFTTFLPASAPAEMVDRILAVVNSEVVTSTELENTGGSRLRQIREKTPADKREKTLADEKKKLLEELIDNLLISQEAENLKITVPEEEIDEAIERVAENNKITVEELQQELARSGIDLKDYRKNISHSIQRSKLISRQINSKIVISDDKAKDYYENVFAKQKTAKGYHVLQIGFPWGTEDASAATAEDARLRAEKIRKLVEEGQDFRELARSFSEMPSSVDGGDLGFFKEDEMAGNMRKILVDLEPGKVSEVIELSGSYQFYMILAANPDGTTTRFAPFSVFKSEISNVLYSKEQKKRYENWIKEIRDRSFIRILL